MRRWLPWLFAALAVAAGVYLVFFRTSTEARVRARLAEVSGAVRVEGVEQNFVLRAARIRQVFNDVFDRRATLQIPELAGRSPDRAMLVALASQAPATYAQASLDLSGLSIDLDRDETSAHAHGRVKLLVTDQQGVAQSDVRAASIRLDLVDGEWRIVSLVASAMGESEAALGDGAAIR